MFYRDCYVSYENSRITIGNHGIRRVLRVEDRALISESLSGSQTVWKNPAAEPRLALAERYVREGTQPRVTFRLDDRARRSAAALVADVIWDDGDCAVHYAFRVYPDIPFIVTEGEIRVQGAAKADAADVVDGVGLPWGHYRLQSDKLVDQSDQHDTYILTHKQLLYKNEPLFSDGNLFTITDVISGDGILLVRDAPTTLSSTEKIGQGLCVERMQSAVLTGAGVSDVTDGDMHIYGASIGVGRAADLPALYRKLYRAEYAGESRGLYSLSNNWGDRGEDAVMGENFVMGEIDTAARTGIDVVQLDDGWQKGMTTGSTRNPNGVWEGYYAFMPDYWSHDPDKFPNGLKGVADYARVRGVKIGLWFSPDSSNDFANWERDVDTLMHYYETYGFSTFKLDGVKLRTPLGKSRYMAFLEAVYRRSGGVVCVNQDITAHARNGIVCEKPYGTLFVENRYSDLHSYYPHRTLRNVWMLSRYFPLRRFQFEVLNLRRSGHVYQGDPLAPGLYSIDYTFASVMLANPLIWMETQHLPEPDRAILENTITLWKSVREEFFAADTQPIGDEPDGVSWTGFEIRGQHHWLLLFRELTESADHSFGIPGNFEKVAGSDGFTYADGIAHADNVRSWALLREV